MTIPERIMEEARKIEMDVQFHLLSPADIIARALLSAEQRGAARERERCVKIVKEEMHMQNRAGGEGFGSQPARALVYRVHAAIMDAAPPAERER